MSRSCPICGAADGERLFTAVSPYLNRRPRYEVIACLACCHRWCEGDVSASTLTDAYSDSFHRSSQQRAALDAQGRPDPQAPIMANALARGAWIRTLGTGDRLLDVGAGNGYFVLAAAQAGFSAEGIDLSTQAARAAADLGVRVSVADFLASDLPSGPFDVVTMWDVLSGMIDQHKTLERIATLTKPGGHLVVTIAVGTSAIARLTRRFWPLMIPPVNLHFFSCDSISRLLAAHGFVIERYCFQPKLVSARFLCQKLARSLGIALVERVAVRLVPERWVLVVNTRDIATVVARFVGVPKESGP